MAGLQTPSPPAALSALPHYLGGVSDSLGHLPPWYQLLSLGGVFCVIHLRNNAVVKWLVVQLHSSLGTEAMWVDEYKLTLQSMSFTERLCFTLYGAALALIVVALFRMLCRDTWSLGLNVGQLFPDKKLPTAAIIVLMCVTESVRLRHVIVEQLDTPGSLASLAMHNFDGIEATEFDPRITESNPHFVVQFELFRAFLMQIITRRVPAVVLAGVYRLFRDVPRKAHVGLRWYMATIAGFFCVQELLGMYVRYFWTDMTAWAMVLWSLTFLGLVNYLYGPSKRAGTVVTMSSTDCVTEAARSLITCAALWLIASLVVLAFVVSVHEELVLIWLFMSLMILWTPAIIDACATDYMAFLAIGAGCVAYAMDSVSSVQAAARFSALHFLWWLSVSLLYNATLHVFASRYVAAAVALLWFLWTLAPPSEVWSSVESTAALGLDGGYGVVHLFAARVVWLCAVADFAPLPVGSWMHTRTQGDGKHAFDLLLHAAVPACAFCVAITTLVERTFTTETRMAWQQRDVVSATPGVLLRKMLRALVVVGCVACSVGVWWVVRVYALPMWTHLLPDIISRALCTVAAVTVLGNLMDMQDSMYVACVRMLGLRDPTLPGGESSNPDDDTPSFATPRMPLNGKDARSSPAF